MIRIKTFSYVFLLIAFISSITVKASVPMQPISKRLRATGTSGSYTYIELPNSGNPSGTNYTGNIAIPTPSTGYTNSNIAIKVEAGINQSADFYYPAAFTETINADVVIYDVSNSILKTTSEMFTIEYEPLDPTQPYKVKDVRLYVDPYSNQYNSVTVTITSISMSPSDAFLVPYKLPQNVYIDMDITGNSNYDFSTQRSSPGGITLGTIPSGVYCQSSDVIPISWNTVDGAENYELEWTFVNDYPSIPGASSYKGIADLPYDFKHNSTRITTACTHYDVTNIFDHGYVVYRVRGVGTDASNNPIEGVWSLPDAGTIATAHNGNYTYTNSCNSPSVTNAAYVCTAPFENNKNWQYKGTFTEEGKRKEVVTFYDGTLRNRQAITRNNQDNTDIIGETIYDYTGRPAVTTLPVPAGTCLSSIGDFNYHPNFNLDVTISNTPGVKYNAADFDPSPTTDTCDLALAVKMSPSIGASNYYSSSNSYTTNAQRAFLPDANQYPFSQVEYTPDNTGRIARQGGVGPDFQLGSGHETKYFYGKPNQIELDRLFGAEAGVDNHYQENLVVDANGQTSVTYMNMEGKVVATCLAGDNGNGNTSYLPSAASGTNTYTVDLFSKNGFGFSNVNTPNLTNDAIEFNSTISVKNTSTYTFGYGLNTTSMSYGCLASDICLSCVYDLTITITDNCGRIVSSSLPVTGTFGYDSDNNLQYNCHTSLTQIDTTTFTLTLNPGVYIVSKILSVDTVARNAYVNAYLNDSTKTTGCIRKYNTFDAGADTSSCATDCSACAASLGTRDNFIASGAGTSLQYDELILECQQECQNSATINDAIYSMMLSDVSPDGQYGQYQDQYGDIDPGMFPLSVYNSNNVLPANLNAKTTAYWFNLNISQANTSAVAYWQNPIVTLNGNTYYEYLEDDGSVSQIIVQNVNGTYSPTVMDPSKVYYDNNAQDYYTSAQNLANLSDFIAEWRESWAQSLVQYHPEYPYYLIYQQYNTTQTTDHISSDKFDYDMDQAQTYSEAISSGFIPSYGGYYTGLDGGYTDPFLTNTYFNVSPNQFGNLLNAQVQHYPNSSSSYNMFQMATSEVLCPAYYGPTPLPSSCYTFDPTQGDNIWSTFKGMYLSAKQALQKQRADQLAMDGHTCNVCIGNTSYNPFAVMGMVALSSFNNFFNSECFNKIDPCSFFTAFLYTNKIKRYGTSTDYAQISGGTNNADYQAYIQTGLCQNGTDLQLLLNTLASNQQLVTTGIPTVHLYSCAGFTQNLYNAFVNNLGVPLNNPDFIYTGVVQGGNLYCQVTASGQLVCSVLLSPATNYTVSWTDVYALSGMLGLGTTSNIFNGQTGYNFSINAQLESQSTTYPTLYVPLQGSTTIDFVNCTFTKTYTANNLGNDISNLMSALLSSGSTSSHPYLTSSTPVSMLPYQSYITQSIQTALALNGSSNLSNLTWQMTSSGSIYTFILKNSNVTPTEQLNIKCSRPSFTLTSASYFTVTSGTSGGLLTVNAYGASNNLLGSITFTITEIIGTNPSTAVSVGTSGTYPTTAECQGDQYDLLNQIDQVLSERLPAAATAYSTNPSMSINLYQSPFMTNLLTSYFPLGATGTTSFLTKNDQYSNTSGTCDFSSPSIDNHTEEEQFYFTDGTTPCTFNLTLNTTCSYQDVGGTKTYGTNPPCSGFKDIIKVNSIQAVGPADNNGDDYNFILGVTYAGNFSGTVYGTSSCIPVKSCSCPTYATPPFVWDNYGDYGTGVNTNSLKMVVTQTTTTPTTYTNVTNGLVDTITHGDTMQIPYIQSYAAYATAVSNLNTKYSWSTSSPNYIPPFSYSDYMTHQLYSYQKTLVDYVNSYIPRIDAAAVLKDWSGFAQYVIAWGNTSQADYKYQRYRNIISYANNAMDSITHTDSTKHPVHFTDIGEAAFCSVLAKNNGGDYNVNAFINYVNNYIAHPTIYTQDLVPMMDSLNINPPTDSVSVARYKTYLNTYHSVNPTLQGMGTACGVASPVASYPVLYSYDDLKCNGYMNASDGYAELTNYITALTTNTFPGGITHYPIDTTQVDTTNLDSLTDAYAQYNEMQILVAKYNSLLPASHANSVIPNMIPTYKDMVQSGYVNSLSAYLPYLQTIVNNVARGKYANDGMGLSAVATSSTTVSPNVAVATDIVTYTQAQTQSLSSAATTASTASVYLQYINTEGALFTSGLTHSASVPAVNFFAANFAPCAPGYFQHALQALSGGNIGGDVSIINFCSKPAICPPAPYDLTNPYPEAPDPDRDPCSQYQVDVSTTNANNDYQSYIDSLKNALIQAYDAHCMHAVENFTYTYTDESYHVTLYYYDQAGNLIKTIPPEGVHPLPILANSDSLEQRIIKLRTQSANWPYLNPEDPQFYPQHGMATINEYNSLNQLVRQKMPDQDAMTILNPALPDGLDYRMVVKAVQFVNEKTGYMAGYIPASGANPDRSLLYTTADGGTTWHRLPNILGATLVKTAFSGSYGVAVSQEGLLIETQDYGQSWDLVPGTPANMSYTDVIVQGGNVVAVTTTGNVVVYSGTSLFPLRSNTSLTTVTLSPACTLNGVSYDATNTSYTAVGSYDDAGNTMGILFTATNPAGTWTHVTNINTTINLNATWLNDVSTNWFYAAGNDGLLLRSNDGGPWQVQPTNTSLDFVDGWFSTTLTGIAIMRDDVAGTQMLYTTGDGGQTWQQANAAFKGNYTALRFYTISGGAQYGVAVGNNGLATRIVYNTSATAGSPLYGLEDISVPPLVGAPDFTDVVIAAYGNTSNCTIMAVGSNDNNLYWMHFAEPTTQSVTEVWNVQATPGSNGFYALNFNFKSSTLIKGVAIDNTGQTLYSFIESTPGVMAVNPYAVTTSAVYTTINHDQTGTFNVYDKTDGLLNALTIDAGTWTITSISATNSIGSSITGGNRLLYTPWNELAMAGDNGLVYYGSNMSNTIMPLPLNDIQAIGVATVKNVAVGNDATILSTTDDATWTLQTSGVTGNFQALAYDNSGGFNNGLIVGDDGGVHNFGVVSGNTVNGPTMQARPGSVLTDVVITPGTGTANTAYITGLGGTLIWAPMYQANAPTVLNYANRPKGNPDLLGIALNGNGLPIACGSGNVLVQVAPNSASLVQQIFATQLWSVNFVNLANGYLVGNNGIMRHTQDNGLSWQIVPVATGDVWESVFTVAPDVALACGSTAITGGTLGKIEAYNNRTPITSDDYTDSYSTDFRTIALNTANATNVKGYVGGEDGRVIPITYNGTSVTYGTALAAISGSPDINGIALCSNGDCVAVGANSSSQGVVLSYDATGSTWSTHTCVSGTAAYTPAALNALYIKDDQSAVAVGNNAEVMTINLTDGSSHIYTSGTQWQHAPFTDPNINSGYATDYNLYTVAYSTFTDGFWGGAYTNTGAPASLYPMARVVTDMSGLYSSLYWYDLDGRAVLNQNTRQRDKNDPHATGTPRMAYSFTRYDCQNRPIQAGEKFENTGTGNLIFPQVFGADINGCYNIHVINNSNMSTWLLSGNGYRREEVTTYYDVQNTTVLSTSPPLQNLWHRVVHSVYQTEDDGSPGVYDHSTSYTYDVHGNVDTLYQYNQKADALLGTGAGLKMMAYTYDLVSGKVNTVAYQPGQPDQFLHRYSYDAENRLTEVCTSRDGIEYDRDAKYTYYLHGPLARVELGQNQVQGVDYAYTLQGWIKAVNSNTLGAAYDMGQDGNTGGDNKNFAYDAMGYSLGYFATGGSGFGDYTPITTQPFLAATTGSDLLAMRADLYNGNITYMATTLKYGSSYTQYPLGMSYQYDQLNRLMLARGTDVLSSNAWGTGSTTHQYHNDFCYDANGNIKTQNKFDGSGTIYDSLTYNYLKAPTTNYLQRNRLYNVQDAAAAGVNPNEVTDQGTPVTVTGGQIDENNNNYKYDETGNLVQDISEQIATIDWTVTNKVNSITRTSGSTKPNMSFDYDAMGNRVAKHDYSSTGAETITYYVRDAQGNEMAAYTCTPNTGGSPPAAYNMIEAPIYGSSRLGIDAHNIDMLSGSNPLYPYVLGLKQYELSNHLGNVLATISDKKLAVNVSGALDHFEADIQSAQDYYPFGELMPGRTFSTSSYRFGFNKQEKDDEIEGAGNSLEFKFRIYDSRLGRFLSVDPLSNKYPWNSPYAFAENDVIRAIDLEGKERWITTQSQLIYGPYSPEYVSANQLKPLESVITSDNVIGAVQAGQESTLFRQLQTTSSLYNKQINSANPSTYTDDATGNINIGKGKNQQQMILDLSWEMTNSTNHDKLNQLDISAKKGQITKEDYIKGKLRTEAEAFVNQALVAKEMNIKDPMTDQYNEDIECVKSGDITKDELINKIADWGYSNAQTKLPNGSNVLIKDIYGEEYDKLNPAKEPKKQ